ncbi:hypothetical protein P154DRAFT_527902 [Amniculicola lignicola CBS 123094]|uniref:ATPase synthesis protein 25 n=1 Tax=Amniculicola lignicola CBS 123094 TaxID=1392246 RepID=A0A6A5VWI8_9PLEO|nr:hypothetical protein P154DRAFT_527902 [Amniculicola lignicola CBS 123094]
MSLPRAISSSLRCSRCPRTLLRPVPATTASNGTLLPRTSQTSRPSQCRAQPFSATARRREDNTTINPMDTNYQDGNISVQEDPLEEDSLEEALEKYLDEEDSFDLGEPMNTSSPALPTDPSIPWYLQPQHARLPPQSDLPLQTLPELPLHPPPLLQPLLEHISLVLGLDDLTLLDLRKLDPPPALGSKLIMIMGTARSEKHLHVSADRFCRWLRREHGLKPNPAGLLGRNELKIKLRRKAKRMKMLANVGGGTVDLTNLDDGIRTGWICCTVGRLDAHPEDTHIPGANVEDFVGFRDVKTGVNVVVQMFTSEKRDEIDLETLWSGVLRTKDREDAKADQLLLETLELSEEERAEKEAEREKELAKQEAERNAELERKTIQDAKDYAAEIDRRKPIPRPHRSTDSPGRVRPAAPMYTGPSRGDAFPVSGSTSQRQMRRLHTVGLWCSPAL